MKISEAIKSLVEKKAQIAKLDKEVRELNKFLVSEHLRTDQKLLLEDGYQSKITHASRRTPIIPVIEGLVGHKLPDHCFKVTFYDSISAKFIGNTAPAELLTD